MHPHWMSKKKWYKLSKSLAIWFPCLQSIIIESLDIQKWEIKRLIKNDFSLGNSTLILTFWSVSYLQSDIFGSLNDQGLLSRASEALVAMDMKHPVSSAHQVFPQIKSDMMYSHPAISSSTAAGTSISRSSNQVLIFIDGVYVKTQRFLRFYSDFLATNVWVTIWKLLYHQ